MADDAIPPWTVHGVRLLHEGLVAVEEHDVETPQGARFAFALVRSPGFAKVVPVTAEGEVVLVRQYRHAVGAVTLELPAGAIAPGESPLDAARRELAEEALLASDRLEPLGAYATSPGRMDEHAHLFLARDCRPDPAAVQDEPTVPVAVPLAEVDGLIGTEVLSATSALALLLALRRLRGEDG